MGPHRFLRWTGIAVSFFVTAAPGVPAQAAAPLVRLDALVGFNGTAREGRFAPVILTIENPGSRMQAEISLRVTWGGAFGAAAAGRTLRREAVLDAGSTRRIPFLIPIPRSIRTLRATVVSQGVAASSLNLELRPMTTTSRIIAVISSELSLDGLSALPGGSGSLRVVYPRVDDLPVGWAGYDAVDAVIVHDTAFQQLRSDQVNALERWVVTGGTLVFTGGAAALQHAPAGFARLLPVEITGLTRAGGVHVPLSGGRAQAVHGTIELAESRLRQGTVIAGDGNLPLVVQRRLGRGAIWFLAFDPTMTPVSTWAGALSMWRSVLGGDRVAAMGAAPREPLADSWITALLGASPASFPSVPALLVFVAIYFALLVPLVVIRPGSALRPRFRLLLLILLTVSMTLAGWAAFNRALFNPGLQVLDAARVDMRSGDGLAAVMEKVAVFSPSAQAVEVRMAFSDAAIEAAGIRTGTADAAVAEAAIVISEKGTRTTIGGLDVQRLSARLLVLQDVVPLEITFRAETRGTVLAAVVTNGAQKPLRGCVILREGRAFPIGDIAAGETVRRSFEAADGVDAAGHGNWFQDGDLRRAGLWKAEAEEADQGHAPARLIGWLDGPILPLTLPGGSWFSGRPGLALLRVEAE
jgi:hypothetical protein